MRTTVLKVSLFLCAFTILTCGQAGAISADYLALTDLTVRSTETDSKTEEKAQQDAKQDDAAKKELEKKFEEAAAAKAKVEAEKAPVQHVVAPGETLTKIATANNTDWKRLFNKNPDVSNPNTIRVGDVIVIPTAEEVLAEREIIAPQPVAVQQTTSQPSSAAAQASVPRQVTRGSSAGNTYAPGYCTWYVKSRRPDIPNRMGNASAWVSSARSQGFATGSAPRVGAVAQSGNHVAYVESVNGGTVTVSEMNWKGLYVTSTRTAPASSFTYIY